MKIHPLLLLSPALLICCGSPDPTTTSTGPIAAHYELSKDWPQLPDSFLLGDPTGVGLDRAQHIWVFCRGKRVWPRIDTMPTTPIMTNTVLMLDRKSGQLIKSWGADRFIMPHGLTVDQHDRIWLTDCGLHQVFCFTSNGDLLLQLGEARVPGNDSAHFNMPTDVAVAADGSFYVSDGYGNSRIVKFDSTGHYLFDWGTKGNRPGQFDIPHAIDLDSAGNAYVADRGNRRVQQFDATGHFQQLWTDSSMADLYSVTIDKSSNSAIAVDWLKRDTVILGSDVWLLDANGHLGDHFGRSGGYDGTVCRYHDVCVDEDGSIYVGDILGDRLQKFVRVPATPTPMKAGH
jgi:peptidylamidoglycolate lyase